MPRIYIVVPNRLCTDFLRLVICYTFFTQRSYIAMLLVAHICVISTRNVSSATTAPCRAPTIFAYLHLKQLKYAISLCTIRMRLRIICGIFRYNLMCH